MTAYLYLLPDKNKQKFKIGKTDNQKRIPHLKKIWKEIDVDSSLMFEYQNNKSMSPVESILHSLFDQYNITDLDKKDGHTEWFEYSCFMEVKDMIEIFSKANRILEVEIEQPDPVVRNRTVKPTPCGVKQLRTLWKFRTEYQQMLLINSTVESHIKKLAEPLHDSISATATYCLNTHNLLKAIGKLNLTILNNELDDIIHNLIVREHGSDRRLAGNYYFSSWERE
jgi:hypothetical protein